MCLNVYQGPCDGVKESLNPVLWSECSKEPIRINESDFPTKVHSVNESTGMKLCQKWEGSTWEEKKGEKELNGLKTTEWRKRLTLLFESLFFGAGLAFICRIFMKVFLTGDME